MGVCCNSKIAYEIQCGLYKDMDDPPGRHENSDKSPLFLVVIDSSGVLK